MSRSRCKSRGRLSFDQGKKSGVNFDLGVVGALVVAGATASIRAIHLPHARLRRNHRPHSVVISLVVCLPHLPPGDLALLGVLLGVLMQLGATVEVD